MRHRQLSALVGLTLTVILASAAAFGTGEALATSQGNGRVILPGHLVPALAHRVPVRSTAGDRALNLSIALRPNNRQGLKTLIAAQNNRQASLYHKYLKPREFAQRFGPSQASVNAAVAFLRSQGLAVGAIAPDNLLIDATGDVATVERAFQVQLADFSFGNRTVYAPTNEPSVPVALGGTILAIGGLDDVALAQPIGMRAVPAGSRPPSGRLGGGPWGGYTPSDLRTAYDMSSLISSSNGAGQTVALFELDGYNPADVNQYLSYYNLGTPQYSDVLVDGATNTPGNNAVEVELDMEVLSAIAPGATQLVYIGPNSIQGLNDTYAKIVSDDLASVTSTSWGSCEPAFGTAELATLDTIFQQGAVQGQAFFAASGDAGAYDCAVGGSSNSTLAVGSPGDDPNVVSVGGTTLNVNSNGTYSSEQAWGCSTCTSGGNDPLGTGSGGGLSEYFSVPGYQNGPGVVNQYSNGMREVPDVAADADPATPYSIYCTVASCTPSGWTTVGGTSAAAPLWAGVAADTNEYLANQSIPTLGTASADLYQLFNTAQTYPAYQDVTSGYNLYYTAGSGYDLATGIGSPDVWNLARDVAAGMVNQQVARTWYFAEGFTGGQFTTYLTLANPNGAAAHVQVQYLLAGGVVITKLYTVSTASRLTKNVNTEIGTGKNVSMVVTSDLPIVAERPMYFTYGGLSGYSIPGGTDIVGATHLDTQFDFGYLDTSTGHDTYLSILNPNSGTMTVSITYYNGSTGAQNTISHTVSGNSRGTVHVNAESGLAAGSYSAAVTLSEPGLVERPMYLVDSVTGFTGAADMVGVPATLSDWYFAEGYTGTNFSERYILSNPGGGSKTVTVTFYTTGSSPISATVTVGGNRQQVLDAGSVLSSGTASSVHVHASGPMLAERFESFKYTGAVGTSGSSNIPGATDVMGAANASEVFYFAEGFTGGKFAEYLTVLNPSATLPANVQVTFLPANGAAPTLKTYTVPATGRLSLNTSSVMPTQSFSMVVESTVPIVAERLMYFSFGAAAQTGGTDVVGYMPNPVWSLYPAPGGAGALFGTASTDVWAVGGGPSALHWDGTTWTAASVPNPTIFGAGFNGGSAISSSDAWAVGSYLPDQNDYRTFTLAEHWDGTSWSIIGTPNPGSYNNNFAQVVALSSNNVWAVGSEGPLSGQQSALIEHWDGTTWSIVSTPSIGTLNGYLNGIAAVSANDVWAVGYAKDSSTNATTTLIEQWNGTSWSVVTSPAPGTSSSLNQISALSASDIWAVGVYYGTNNVPLTLTEHWNGTSWSVVNSPSPNSAPGGQNSLIGLYARTTSDIWAVGYTYNGSSFYGLVEHWDGAKWSIVPSPTSVGYLSAVVAFGPDDAWAVGGSSIVRYS